MSDTAEKTEVELSPQARWNTQNPLARWAHNAVESAIRRGLLERGPCRVCGAVHGVDGAVIHGHHSDYARPLDVDWLCRLHHRQLHAAERSKNGEAGQ